MPIGIIDPGTIGAAKRQQDYEQGLDASDIANCKIWFRSDLGITKAGADLVSQWNDQSGNTHHATQSDDAKKFTWIDQSFGTRPSLYADAGTRFMTLGNVADVNYERTDSFSFAMWLSIAGFTIIPFSKQAGGVAGYISLINATNLKMYLVGSSGYPGSALEAQGAYSFTANKWTHICITYDGTQVVAGVKMYVNGQPLSVTAATDTLNTNIANAADFEINNRSAGAGGLGFTGYVYELASWGAVLAPTQALRIYNRGKWPLGI